MIQKKLIFFAFCSLFFFSCDRSGFLTGPSNSGQSTNNSSLSFKVNWKPNSNGTSELQWAPSFDCTTAGVFDVELVVFDSFNMRVGGNNMSCSSHSGGVTVPVGSNLTLVFLGKTSGRVLYRGEVGGITVQNGQTTDAGTITASYFVPTFLSPANNSRASSRTVTFSWSPVTGASRYAIKIFGNWQTTVGGGGPVLKVQEYTTATTFTTTLPSADMYGWSVDPYDAHGDSGGGGGSAPSWVVVVP